MLTQYALQASLKTAVPVTPDVGKLTFFRFELTMGTRQTDVQTDRRAVCNA